MTSITPHTSSSTKFIIGTARGATGLCAFGKTLAPVRLTADTTNDSAGEGALRGGIGGNVFGYNLVTES